MPHATEILGSLCVILLGVLIQILRDVSGKLTAQGELVVRVATYVGIDGNGLGAKVDAAHERIDAMQRRENDDLRSQLADADHRRRDTDNRTRG
jgi:hypothetical protein